MTNRIVFLATSFIMFSCEPLVTTFDGVENAVLYEAKHFTGTPESADTIKVMTWNVRFGIGRLPFFGDSCGDRSIFPEGEVLSEAGLSCAPGALHRDQSSPLVEEASQLFEFGLTAHEAVEQGDQIRA